MEEKWYGQKGIDTEYERSRIAYRPNLIYPERESAYPMAEETILQISRSQDFMISKAIINYRKLLEKIEELLSEIEAREPNQTFYAYLDLLKANKLEEVFDIEREQSGYQGNLNFEMYTMLYKMKQSIETQILFLDEYYRTQFTDESEEEKMFQAEMDSIKEWIKAEYDVSASYDQLTHGDEFDYQLEQQIEELEKKRRKLDVFHTSLGDIGYIHQNRYLMFEDILQQAEELIQHPQGLIDDNVDVFIRQVGQLSSAHSFKSHLILSFKKYNEMHFNLKQQYITTDMAKEKFASEKQYMFQQIMTQANEEVRDWLYEQPEDSGKALDLFATFMVDSLEESKRKYEESLADLLNFYKMESSFYGRQISLMQKKEEIRLFYRIIEDLEEEAVLSDEWIAEYLQAQGYTI